MLKFATKDGMSFKSLILSEISKTDQNVDSDDRATTSRFSKNSNDNDESDEEKADDDCPEETMLNDQVGQSRSTKENYSLFDFSSLLIRDFLKDFCFCVIDHLKLDGYQRAIEVTRNRQ